MLDFLSYINYTLNEDVHTHSVHLEDLLITKNKKGPAVIIAGLSTVTKQISGVSSSNVSTKIDGAPAIYAGYLGTNFFVATKSLFNKSPKINFTEKDIDENHPSGPNKTLKLALKYLKNVIPKGKILQGDFLFDNSTLKRENINGEELLTYHPNTIKYTVPVDSKLGKKIANSKIGIVFHTEYSSDGINPQSIKLKGFNVTSNMWKNSKDVFAIDAFQTDATKTLSFSKTENNIIDNLIKELKGFSINWSSVEILKDYLLVFTNTYYRLNTIKPKPEIRYNEFIEYIENKLNKEVSEKKTEKGKDTAKNKYQPILIEIQNNKKDLIKLFKIQDNIQEVKHILIHKLNELKNTQNFLVKTNGEMIATGDEGYVIAKTSAKSVKLVDRLSFSTSNFSPDFLRGFDI